MNCPACNATDTIKWIPPRYECSECGHEITRREMQMELEARWDNWLASPPDPADLEVTP